MASQQWDSAFFLLVTFCSSSILSSSFSSRQGWADQGRPGTAVLPVNPFDPPVQTLSNHYKVAEEINYAPPKEVTLINLECQPANQPHNKAWRMQLQCMPPGVSQPQPRVKSRTLLEKLHVGVDQSPFSGGSPGSLLFLAAYIPF
jgi:hypothetical protein